MRVGVGRVSIEGHTLPLFCVIKLLLTSCGMGKRNFVPKLNPERLVLLREVDRPFRGFDESHLIAFCSFNK